MNTLSPNQLAHTDATFLTWNGDGSALRISDTEWETPDGEMLTTAELARLSDSFTSATPWMTPEMFDRLRVIDRGSADAAQCCATREQVLSLSVSPKWQAAVRAM